MSETVVGILGLLTIAAIVVTLFKSKTQPAIAFIIWPTILAIALVIGGYYKLPEISKLIKGGFGSTGSTAALFVFSVLYFGIMTDAGMFDVIINKLMKLVGDNVIGVAIVTAVIALVGHLDGGGASTFCIVIPAMLPVYERMHMRKTTLLRIAVLAMGVLNLMPWAGPTMRAATVIDMPANQLWMKILPIQIFGIVLALVHAGFAGWQEKKRGAGLHGRLAQEEGTVNLETQQKAEKAVNELARPKLFWFNIALTLCVIALLIVGGIDSLGLDIPRMHKKIINLHAGPALMMCSTLMGAAVLMGILVYGINDAGKAVIAKMENGVATDKMATISVVTCMANLIKNILPKFLGQNLPLVIGFLSVPLALAFDTDSYFFGMLPVVIGIGASFGVDKLPIAIAMVVCRTVPPLSAPIKASFLYVWGFSILCMIVGVIFGLLPI